MQLQPKERHNMNSTAQAADPALSAEEQATLAQTGTPEVREALAANPGLVDTQQHYLATTGSIKVRCKLAGNPNLTPAVQALLAQHSDYDVRLILLNNLQLAPEVKATVIASFCQADLENVQRRATYANEEWSRLKKESIQASEKFHQSAMLGDIPIFNSVEKKRLEREASRASECAKAAASAYFHWTAQERAISEILSQQGVKLTPTIFSDETPSFLRSQAS